MSVVLKDTTVTNTTTMTQLYRDYRGEVITVAAGATVTFQEIESQSEAALPDENIPTGSRYLKLKNATGQWAYIYPIATRLGIKTTPTVPAD
jgi:hypothetical protein